MRTSDTFDAFFSVIKKKATEFDISEPVLPRNRRAPQRFEVGEGLPTFAATCDDHYRRIFFEAIDLAVNAIHSRFDQPGFVAYAQMETLLLNCLNEKDFSSQLDFLKREYGNDIEILNFESQLSILKTLLSNGTYSCFRDIYSAFQALTPASKCLLSEVKVLLKLILVNPATDAVGERSFSTARRIKTWLRSSMNQCRFNNLAVLTVHKERTDTIDLLSVANEFTALNENRQRHFGRFTKSDIERI